MAVGNTKIIQVTNIAPQATKDQMQTLFGYLGKIEDIRLYPTIRDVSCPVQSRICYIKFVDSSTVGIAQHMTNTVFIDRALIVIPVQNGEIPDEYYALEMTRNGTIVPGLHVNEPKLPPHVVNTVQGTGNDQVIVTSDPQLEANGLSRYPPLPVTYDSTKIEETRRTICVLNINPSLNSQDIISHFSQTGEVKYLRTANKTSTNEPLHLIEFTDQPSVLNALKISGTDFKGNIIEVQHSTQAIVKPQAKSNEAAQKEIEEAMSRFKEAQNMISASIEPVIGMLTKDKRNSRRSRSRSRGRRRRSRSRSRRRSRSHRRRSGSRSRRTRSRDRKRRSRSRKRSSSRSRRSRSRISRSRRSRSKSSSWRRKSRDRESTSRAKSKDRRSRDHSKDRKRSRDRKSRDEDREKSKVRDRSKEREKSKDKERGKSKEKSKERDIEKCKERDSKSRESKEKKSDKESSVDTAVEKKKSRDKSRSRSKYRSRSRDRKKKDRRRSRSRGSRRRSPSPARKRRSRSRSRDKKRDKYDKKESKKDRERMRDRSRSHSKVPRNYDEEEKGFERTDKDKYLIETENITEKEASEKSDNMDISNSP